MGRCGKRLVRQFVHIAPDGTETVYPEPVGMMNAVAQQGGKWERRSKRI